MLAGLCSASDRPALSHKLTNQPATQSTSGGAVRPARRCRRVPAPCAAACTPQSYSAGVCALTPARAAQHAPSAPPVPPPTCTVPTPPKQLSCWLPCYQAKACPQTFSSVLRPRHPPVCSTPSARPAWRVLLCCSTPFVPLLNQVHASADLLLLPPRARRPARRSGRLAVALCCCTLFLLPSSILLPAPNMSALVTALAGQAVHLA